MNRLCALALALAVVSPGLVAGQGVSPGAHRAQAYPQLVRPGDIVRLRIWREPDLSGEFPVNDNGVAVFPKIGDMLVTTKTPDELRDTLKLTYATYLRDPAIEVTVLKRLTVVGAVIHAGVFPVDPTMTLADVIALSGGPTPFGNPTQAYLIRNQQRVPLRLNLTDRVADLPVQSGDQIYVPERSWIARNAAVVAASVTAVTSLIVALYIRR